MLLINCPICGRKICKADNGTHIYIQCSKCSKFVDVIVNNEKITISKK